MHRGQGRAGRPARTIIACCAGLGGFAKSQKESIAGDEAAALRPVDGHSAGRPIRGSQSNARSALLSVKPEFRGSSGPRSQTGALGTVSRAAVLSRHDRLMLPNDAGRPENCSREDNHGRSFGGVGLCRGSLELRPRPLACAARDTPAGRPPSCSILSHRKGSDAVLRCTSVPPSGLRERCGIRGRVAGGHGFEP